MLESDHDSFIVELGLLEGLLKEQRRRPHATSRVLERVERFIRHFEAHMDAHFKAEETAVFPFLRRHAPGMSGTLLVLIAEHRVILRTMAAWKRSFRNIQRNVSAADPRTSVCLQGLELVRLLRTHVLKESRIMRRYASN
jgi:hemerythrin-like domain-containing protein